MRPLSRAVYCCCNATRTFEATDGKCVRLSEGRTLKRRDDCAGSPCIYLTAHFTGLSRFIYHPSTLLPVPAAWHLLYANRSTAPCAEVRRQFESAMDTYGVQPVCFLLCRIGTRAKTDVSGVS